MKRINISLASQLLLASLFLTGCATKSKVAQQLQVDQDPVFQNAIVGVSIYDMESRTYLFEQNANKRLVPASNTKLLTTYASLKYLPEQLPGWFWKESNDTLFVKPNGDPTLLHEDFKQQHLLDFLSATQKPVTFLLEEDPGFTRLGSGWSWSSYQSTSFPERSQMPIYANMVRFRIANGQVYTYPSYFENFVAKDGELTGTGVNVRRAETSNDFIARSANSNSLSRPITQNSDPAVNFRLLADTLHRSMPNLRLSYRMVPSKSLDLSSFNTLYTYPKDEILGIMMKRSDNFIAEQLLMMVGTAQAGQLSDNQGIRFLLQNDFKELPNDPDWADGSGLSRNNMMSPRFFVGLLTKLNEEFGWDRVTQILPRGDQGTLRGLYKGYEDRIFAKTGTLSATVALSGYLVTKKNKRLIFSVLVNNQEDTSANVRKSIERYLTQIIDKY